VLAYAVPNFSEGRSEAVIAGIAAAIASGGARVLHVDPNPDAHRTVITLAGELDVVCESLFLGVSEAQRSIDMRQHSGEHIRIGAADVVPIVALEPGNVGPSVDALCRRIADGLGIPLFLYERSARRPAFASLPRCRRGGYEALKARFAQADDGPDLGPQTWTPAVAQTGATAIGARDVLVAMNFTLGSTDRDLAHRIALAIRSNGAVGRPDRFDRLRAVGWVMEGYEGRAQVSVNLLDPRLSSAHAVLQTIRRLAAPIPVLGAELIGLTPARVLIAAALDAQGLPQEDWPAEQVLDGPASSREDLLLLGGQVLGLSHLSRAQGMGRREVLARVLEWQLGEAGLLPG
jgi:glutamate formiminotransferase